MLLLPVTYAPNRQLHQCMLVQISRKLQLVTELSNLGYLLPAQGWHTSADWLIRQGLKQACPARNVRLYCFRCTASSLGLFCDGGLVAAALRLQPGLNPRRMPCYSSYSRAIASTSYASRLHQRVHASPRGAASSSIRANTRTVTVHGQTAVALSYGGHCTLCGSTHWLPCTDEAAAHGEQATSCFRGSS